MSYAPSAAAAAVYAQFLVNMANHGTPFTDVAGPWHALIDALLTQQNLCTPALLARIAAIEAKEIDVPIEPDQIDTTALAMVLNVPAAITEARELTTTTLGQTSITLAHTPAANSQVKMFRNGVLLDKVASSPTLLQFSISGTTVTLGPSILLNDKVTAIYWY